MPNADAAKCISDPLQPSGDSRKRGDHASISAPFIDRPVATTLLTIGITLAGIAAFLQLPVAPLPQVDYPTI